MNRSDHLKQGEKGAWLSIIAYLILASSKLYIASIGNSDGLRADGLNNLTDIVTSVAVLIGLKIARKPPDDIHRYGHYRAETIASLFAAFIMMFIGIQVIIEAGQKLINSSYTQPDMLTAWTAIFAAVIMLFVYRFNLRLSKKIESGSLYAAAMDNKADALVSIGVFIGIIGAQFGLFWLDPLTAGVVGIIICKTAWDIFKDSTITLTDGFDDEKLTEIKETIDKDPSVLRVDDIKGRIHGNQELLDITIHVDPNLTVAEGHEITDRIEEYLYDKHRISHALIHIEPFEEK
ncbi:MULTISPECIES: cation diffusion facilitator family transporter [unclassified Oceanobacillus]|uniref:cation diffusion facilitator family transporter n=1 Tax=unclassified Oceanobacillus TaxID=2630292 RepID=UPI001BE85755|nr:MULTISPECIES: cation diffusion facilitator family transporter [unclassified Oceanobacillus]MBT2599169.1 cation transporter [Oceanobacillus sp. ISL-74]MBT2652087.1 cation transporter [Oceanobacillus sp. ISL-73]